MLQSSLAVDKAQHKTLEGHFDNLKQMAVYCENQVDCRRYLQLIHLGEKFDRKICIQNSATTCDNCENFRAYDATDVTKHAKDLARLVSDLSQNQNVTMLHVAEVYKGSMLKKIVDYGHDKHPLHGAGKGLSKPDIHRILKELIFKNVLGDFCTFNREFPVVYIKKGTKYNAINASNGK